jgi:hypothetical protein
MRTRMSDSWRVLHLGCPFLGRRARTRVFRTTRLASLRPLWDPVIPWRPQLFLRRRSGFAQPSARRATLSTQSATTPRVFGASGSPILNRRGNLPCCSNRQRVVEWRPPDICLHSASRTISSSSDIAPSPACYQVTANMFKSLQLVNDVKSELLGD